jgi:hypothetical protein
MDVDYTLGEIHVNITTTHNINKITNNNPLEPLEPLDSRNQVYISNTNTRKNDVKLS